MRRIWTERRGRANIWPSAGECGDWQAADTAGQEEQPERHDLDRQRRTSPCGDSAARKCGSCSGPIYQRCKACCRGRVFHHEWRVMVILGLCSWYGCCSWTSRRPKEHDRHSRVARLPAGLHGRVGSISQLFRCQKGNIQPENPVVCVHLSHVRRHELVWGMIPRPGWTWAVHLSRPWLRIDVKIKVWNENKKKVRLSLAIKDRKRKE